MHRETALVFLRRSWRGLCPLALATLLVACKGQETTSPDSAGGQASTVSEAASPQPFFVAISVADMQVSVDWYQRVLGFDLVRATDLPERGLQVRLLQHPTGLLELICDERARPPGVEKRFLQHGLFKFGFLVADLDVYMARLAELDVPLRGEAFQEDDLGTRSVQIVDPDGNVLQIFERL